MEEEKIYEEFKKNKKSIDPDSIVNTNEILLFLDCPICLNICFEISMCSTCYSVFCKNCAETSKFTKCPLCNDPKFKLISNENNLIPVDYQIKKFILKCENHDYGCETTTNIFNYESHSKLCQYKISKCVLCLNSIASIHQVNHLLDTCSNSKIECYMCDSLITIRNIDSHLKDCSKIHNKCENCLLYYNIENKSSIDNSSKNTHNKCDLELVICSRCNLPDIKEKISNNKHVCTKFSDLFNQIKLKDVKINNNNNINNINNDQQQYNQVVDINYIEIKEVNKLSAISNISNNNNLYDYSQIKYNIQERLNLEEYFSKLKETLYEALIYNSKEIEIKKNKFIDSLIKLTSIVLKQKDIEISLVEKEKVYINNKINRVIASKLENKKQILEMLSKDLLILYDLNSKKIANFSELDKITNLNKSNLKESFEQERVNKITNLELLNSILYSQIVSDKVFNMSKITTINNIQDLVLPQNQDDFSQCVSQRSKNYFSPINNDNIISKLKLEQDKLEYDDKIITLIKLNTENAYQDSKVLEIIYKIDHVFQEKIYKDVRMIKPLKDCLCNCNSIYPETKCCSNCSLMFCKTCSQYNPLEQKDHSIERITAEPCSHIKRDSGLCKYCSKNCTICKGNICVKCSYSCFFTECKSNFCTRCFSLNKHQIRAENNVCTFLPCPICHTKIECLMTSIQCGKCDQRICCDCFFKGEHDKHSPNYKKSSYY